MTIKEEEALRKLGFRYYAFCFRKRINEIFEMCITEEKEYYIIFIDKNNYGNPKITYQKYKLLSKTFKEAKKLFKRFKKMV